MQSLRIALPDPPSPFAANAAAAASLTWGRLRRGGVLATVIVVHAIVLWVIATMTTETRDALPTFLQVMLIPQPPSPKPAAPVSVVPIASPNFKTEITTPPMPLPKIEIAPETSAPPQPLVKPTVEPRVDPLTSTVVAGAKPTAPVPAAVAPTAAPATPVALQAVVNPPSPVDIPPSAIQYLQMPQVIYPALSRRRRESGLVIVSTLVDRDGRPAQTQVFQSSGFDRLDEAAIAAVQKARFKPYVLAGVQTAGWVRIPITFELES